MGQDPYKYFRIEARELLDQLEKGVLALERGEVAPGAVAGLLRLAHTLKGAARVVKQREIAELAHQAEDVMAPLREGGAPSREAIERLLGLVDAMGGRLQALAPAAATSAAAAPADDRFRTLRAEVDEIDELLAGLAEAQGRLTAVRKSLAAGELERGVGLGLEQVDRELRQVREAAERLRLLPARLLFDDLARAVRDVAQSQGKRATFAASGGELRLDADVLAALQAPLAQICRNAVAHGLEAEVERRAAGKPPEGRVVLAVRRRGQRVTFDVEDDGRGIDLEAVRRVALRRGMPVEEAARLGPDALVALLGRGGLSTHGAVTEVAGRGIGLEIVRAAAERLGGELQIETVAGRGTTFAFAVPLTLAAVEALLVEVDGRAAAIPLEAVRRAIRLEPARIARTPAGASIALDGQRIPFAPLALALRAAPRPAAAGRAWSAVVVASSGSTCAVGVDRVLGVETVLLRPLPKHTPADPVVVGAALDAEGNPRVVLDAEALVAAAARLPGATEAPADPPLPLLVVDDSLTTRMLEQSILESAGFEVEVASSAEEGLERARRRRFGLFLVDVEMPGMDGFAFVATTRADPRLAEIPAILVTSRDSVEDRRRGEEVGAHAYIVKSEFDQGQLLAHIRRLVT